MEDAHVVETTVPYPPGLPYLKSKKKEDIPCAKVFGVFDGHGGPEVARFCQLYLVSVLTKQELWQEEPQTGGNPEGNATNTLPGQSHVADNTRIGQALITSFHALDRMIDDPNRRDEIIRLRTQKAPQTERRDAGTIPPVKAIETDGASVVKVAELAGGSAENVLPPPPPPNPTPPPETASEDGKEKTSDGTPESDEKSGETFETGSKPEGDQVSSGDAASESATEDETASDSSSNTASTHDEATFVAETPSDDTTAKQEPVKEEREDGKVASGESDDDYDSDEAVGKEEAVRDQSLDDDEDSNDDVQINPYDGAIQVVESSAAEENAATDPANPPNKVTVMFQRLLNMNENQGQMVIRVAGEDADKTDDPADQIQAPVHTGPSASSPSILQNGRLICNLPDHPIHAGCTAVVAVLLGMTLTIANAGDSRGVLCLEGGLTEPLSFDHKPQQPREMNRINNAGGFVNRFGRVNGNLNLSRSIGDLKYKQVPGIAPADQMITAQPDILQVTLNPKDEFFILGCDGIWDCLTNEKAVEFVRERIDTKEPKEIGEEMLNTILSDDPRATQGIGGDNMTVLIVDLQPASRSYKIDPAWGPAAPSAL